MTRLWLWLPRWLRIALLAFASLVLLLLVLGCAGWWYLHPAVERSDGVVYGLRNGEPLALDVIRPRQRNGHGVALMVSGGWKSGSPGSVPVWMMAPLLRRGYTIFAIYHGDADTLVPLEQSEWFRDRAVEHGHDVKIVIHPGGQHGWLTMILDLKKFADWFDLHLRSDAIIK